MRGWFCPRICFFLRTSAVKRSILILYWKSRVFVNFVLFCNVAAAAVRVWFFKFATEIRVVIFLGECLVCWKIVSWTFVHYKVVSYRAHAWQKPLRSFSCWPTLRPMRTYENIGKTYGKKIKIDKFSEINLEELRNLYENWFKNFIKGK